MIKKYQFKFKPLPTVFFSLIFIILLALSFWQFKRAETKKEMLAQYELAIKKPILDLSKIDSWKDLPPYQQVKIRGHYDNQHQFLLDNKTNDGQVGYEVLTPFYSGEHVVIVNRGWIARTGSRQQLPLLKDVKDEQIIIGKITPVPKKPFTLGDIEENPQQWHRVIQAVDFSIINRALNQSISPFIIQLDPDVPHGFVRNWSIITVSPAKHIGYSIQWGLLALVQLIVLVRYNLQRKLIH